MEVVNIDSKDFDIIGNGIRKMNKKLFLAAAISTTVGMTPFYSHAVSHNPEQPNIVFINVDDLGWTDLGFMGSDYYETPNIDQLSSEGIVFNDAYAPAANCAPSRACVLTGQNTPRHGVYTVGNPAQGPEKERKLIPINNTRGIEENNITFASILQDAGYKTATIGKWHISEDPLKHGFDVNIGGAYFGYPINGYFSPWDIPNLENGEDGDYLPERLNQEAINFIKNTGDQPYLLYLPYFLVHTPIQAKPESVEKYLDKEANPDHHNATYAAMVEAMDDRVGKLLKAIDESGAKENTLVLLTSDNGGVQWVSRQDPLRGGKGSYFEGGIRVPMIARWPGNIDGGQVSNEPVTGIDLFPTFVDAANLDIPENKIIDGDSLLPLMQGREGIKERSIFWHYPIYLKNIKNISGTRHEHFRVKPGSAVRKGDWKLHLLYEDNSYELYNVVDDIGETLNLVDSKPEQFRVMKAEMDYWLEKTNAPIPTEINPKYDPQ